MLNRNAVNVCLYQGLSGQVASDSFTPDMTPLMLAAHRDNYEIIKILLERGDRIPKPHSVQCPCKQCIAFSHDDILCHSRSARTEAVLFLYSHGCVYFNRVSSHTGQGSMLTKP